MCTGSVANPLCFLCAVTANKEQNGQIDDLQGGMHHDNGGMLCAGGWKLP